MNPVKTSRPISLRSILIETPIHAFISQLGSSVQFSLQMSCVHSLFLHATCSTTLILLYLITSRTYDKEYKILISEFCNFLSSTPLRAMQSSQNVVIKHSKSSLMVTDHSSHQYTIIILYSLINLRFIEGIRGDKSFYNEWYQGMPEFNLIFNVFLKALLMYYCFSKMS